MFGVAIFNAQFFLQNRQAKKERKQKMFEITIRQSLLYKKSSVLVYNKIMLISKVRKKKTRKLEHTSKLSSYFPLIYLTSSEISCPATSTLRCQVRGRLRINGILQYISYNTIILCSYIETIQY